MSGIPSFPPGLLPEGMMIGFVRCPEGHDPHPVCFTGNVLELTMVAKALGLSPSEEDLRKIATGTKDDSPLALTDDKGSYVTTQSAMRAAEFLARQH